MNWWNLQLVNEVRLCSTVWIIHFETGDLLLVNVCPCDFQGALPLDLLTTLRLTTGSLYLQS